MSHRAFITACLGCLALTMSNVAGTAAAGGRDTTDHFTRIRLAEPPPTITLSGVPHGDHFDHNGFSYGKMPVSEFKKLAGQKFKGIDPIF
ncbi:MULTISPECIES: hypothetical protein [Actinomycetes]|uniref:hypothetical protein n=1 Tax=Actinomycetes TaxID=1760 RepID=UPI0004CC6C58|nr:MULTISPECIES: hypothetical protein [Actinomycetes]